MPVELSVNGRTTRILADDETPLLYVLRNDLGLVGTRFGCGMGLIALGDGIVGIEAIVKELVASGFDGPTTLEIAGEDAVKVSAERLRQWSAK